jgi:hypothetical protein
MYGIFIANPKYDYAQICSWLPPANTTKYMVEGNAK